MRSVWLLIVGVALVALPLETFGQDEESIPNDEQSRLADEALKAFAEGKPEAMDRESVKFDQKGQRIKPNQRYLGKKGAQQFNDPLQQQAQFRTDDRFYQKFCEKILKKLPGNKKLDCKAVTQEGKAPINEANDSVDDLVDGWIEAEDIVRNVDGIPVSGKVKEAPWSDDYWRIQWGITSFRYKLNENGFTNYKDAVAAYQQPQAFLDLGNNLKLIASTSADWSPAEKYDLTVGDEDFTLTNEQKSEGENNLNEKGDVEDWMGICHGWAPAAFMIPAPKTSVTVTGAKGAKVTWYAHDVRAMGSLAWANGDTNTNFIGGRCNAKKVKKHKNGRLADEDCFDNNPGTFIMALGNMVGKKKKSFVIDRTFDYEVWNQPVVSYKLEFFNPLKPNERRGKKWEDFVVPYDAAFKKKDRFQKPNTRLKDGSDKHIKQIVGVRARVEYGSESFPVQDNNPGNATAEFTSQFDLELGADGEILGGEWYDNNHVDFMWIPGAKEVATTSHDEEAPKYSGKVSESLTETAVAASGDGYPLCNVLAFLVNKSSGKKYTCPN